MNQIASTTTPAVPEKWFDSKIFALILGLVSGATIIIAGQLALQSMPTTGDLPSAPSRVVPGNPILPANRRANPPTNPNPPADHPVHPPTNPNPPADQ